MLRYLLRSKPGDEARAAHISRPVYAIGDIHGRADLLKILLEKIRKDIAESDFESVQPAIVFLGDYIDRGPSSHDVVDIILRLEDSGQEIHPLKGNHEEALLQFLADTASGPAWFMHGGLATLQSYKIKVPDPSEGEVGLERARLALIDALGPTHLAFFQGLKSSFIQDDYAFVHAGIRWGKPFAEQDETDLLWIRQDFLSADGKAEYVIVHGHTPADSVYIGPQRIGVDTGAYASGVLSSLKLWKASRSVLQSR
ncbi:MAG TPA: metallophosphoesterase [Rhizomicrobium sp.]|nr:metallophosphoesterase [Rhizomicrobium sp.]